MNIYYVYFYLRSNFTPYYVGKGKDDRAWKKSKNEIKLPKNKSKIILVEQNLTEFQAFILERYYIRWFGRKDNGTGILRNKTNGGEGTSGKIVSDNVRYKISIRNKGKPKTEKARLKMSQSAKQRQNNPFRGKTHSEKSKEKQSIIKKGKKRTLESRIKQSNSIKGHETTKGTKEKISKKAKERVISGIHNFISFKGTVPCYNKQGEYIRLPKEKYHSQSGPKENWELVHNRSSEGKIRKNYKSFTIPSYNNSNS